jgi:hypothetical protein
MDTSTGTLWRWSVGSANWVYSVSLMGPAGANGTNGADGSMVNGAYISGDDHLHVTTNTGSDFDAGNVRGPQGPQGDPGPNSITCGSTPTGCSGMLYGNGSTVQSDSGITTDGSGTLSVGGSLNVTASVGCSTVNATIVQAGQFWCGMTDGTDPTSQPIVGRMPIYDGGGTLLGYMPIYQSP